MNYITNQTDQVIAADDSLLTLLNVESIEELTRQIILDNIHFTTLSKQSISITTDTQTFTFDSHTSILSSMVGNLNLITLKKPLEDDSTVFEMDDKAVENTEPQDADLMIDDELIFIKEDETPTTLISPKEPIIEPATEPSLSYDDEISLLSDTDEIKKETNDDALFDLIIPQAPEATIDEIAIDEISIPHTEYVEEKDDTPSLDTTPIIIDVNKVSESIGISQEDYTLFLNEYIDTAISLEDDLKSTENEKRSSAIASLTQLSSVLQLPFVNEIMATVSQTNSGAQGELLESFYAVLARFVTSHEPKVQALDEVQKEDILEELELTQKEPISEPTLQGKGFGSINLDNVVPIHFDFRMEEAANDLSLPVELIEEFVHDFIEQAHIETKKMLLAHEEGDLDAIQKIGHMLKGASSNLRINALSDTLYQIQFCEDSSKLEGFIKHYWGHFLSFEQQVDILSKRN